MKIQERLQQKYEKEKSSQLNHADDNTREYHQYIFDKTEEWAEKMEEILDKDHGISFNEMEETLNDIDDGMSNFQYYVILSLLKRYWVYSNYIVVYERLKEI